LVNGRTAPGDPGFTLIELVIAVAIVAAAVATGVGLSASSRSLAVATAASEFDRILSDARTIARQTAGATIAFAPDAYGDGTQVRVLTAGADGTLVPTTLPVVQTRATIGESEVLGDAPFAFVVHATGLLGGRPGFRAGDATTAPETGCPAGGSFHFTIRAAGGSAERFVPCRIDLASTGTVSFAAWPSASVAPLPTPCASCTSASLPPVPSSSPTCPPGFTAIAGGCAPANGSPNYHVTATAAAPAATPGGSDTVTAQATLANPLSVPPGVPASVPVAAQTADATCSVSPGGSQPSGSAFTVAVLAVGSCTITLRADLSGVPGATADSATVTIAISPAPVATGTPPPASSCDLVRDGKCYMLIVPETNQQFTKFVAPATSCATDDPTTCQYIDQVSGVYLSPGFAFQSALPPADESHELLFEIEKVTGVENGCLLYTQFSGVPTNEAILWPAISVGAPVAAPLGFGKPDTFFTQNHVNILTSNPPTLYPWTQGTTFTDLFTTVLLGSVGSPDFFTYYGATGTSIQWNPDFAGCDALGDANVQGNAYGNARASLSFRIYQAQQ
jgi:prepilin-type N-terminal cleavage/methylation domain-containing protein